MSFYQVKRWEPQDWGLIRYGETHRDKAKRAHDPKWGWLERSVGCSTLVNRSRFRGH